MECCVCKRLIDPVNEPYVWLDCPDGSERTVHLKDHRGVEEEAARQIRDMEV